MGHGAEVIRGTLEMRILFLAVFCLLLSVSGAFARELRLSHQWPEGTDARDRAARLFAQQVQLRAPELTIRIYPKLSLGIEAPKQFEALQSGDLDMSVYVPPYAVKKVPEFSLAVLPGLYPSLEAVRGLRGSKLLEYLQAVAHKNGVHIVTWWWVPGGFVNTKQEIAGPETVRGLRLRGGDPLFDLMLEKAGAVPVDLTSDRLYAAMRSGELDGTLTSYETFVSTKIYEQAKFFTAGSPGIWMFLNTLMVSKSVWDGLSASQRQAFDAAAEISEDYFAAAQRDAEKRFIEVFTEAGARPRIFTKEDYLAWLHLAQETAWVEYLAISPEAKTMLYNTIQTILANDLQ
jgi:TRAP-type transport system periplasmic protein